MRAFSVDSGAKDGDDFDDIGAEAFFAIFGFLGVKDGDFDIKEAADHEDDFTSEAQQSVFVGEDKFLYLALEDENDQLAKTGRFKRDHPGSK